MSTASEKNPGPPREVTQERRGRND